MCCFILKILFVIQGILELWKILTICIENFDSACADAQFAVKTEFRRLWILSKSNFDTIKGLNSEFQREEIRSGRPWC